MRQKQRPKVGWENTAKWALRRNIFEIFLLQSEGTTAICLGGFLDTAVQLV
jgi:hypothetical protein